MGMDSATMSKMWWAKKIMGCAAVPDQTDQKTHSEDQNLQLIKFAQKETF